MTPEGRPRVVQSGRRQSGLYTPVTIEFGDAPVPDGWSRHAQPLPLLLQPGAFLRRLRLTIREHVNEAGAAEAVVHLEWAAPPAPDGWDEL